MQYGDVCEGKILFAVTLKSIMNVGSKLEKEDKNRSCLVWYDTLRDLPDEYRKAYPWQIINRMPGINYICRKTPMVRLINRMMKFFPELYNFIPKSFIIPVDRFKLQKEMQDSDKTFIIKPDQGSLGTGILILKGDKFGQIDNRPAVAQEYITSAEIRNTKFDLRIYALLGSVDPLRIYVFRDGIARFCSEEVSANNIYSQITNTFINKSNTKTTLDDITKTVQEVFDTIADKVSPMELWSEIDNIIVLTIISSLKICRENEKKICPPYRFNRCFQLLGFDILIGSDYKPYLLEVNYRPSLAVSTKAEALVKPEMMECLLKIVLPPYKYQETLRSKTEVELQIGYQTAINNVRFVQSSLQLCQGVGKFEIVYPSKDKQVQETWDHVISTVLKLSSTIDPSTDLPVDVYTCPNNFGTSRSSTSSLTISKQLGDVNKSNEIQPNIPEVDDHENRLKSGTSTASNPKSGRVRSSKSRISCYSLTRNVGHDVNYSKTHANMSKKLNSMNLTNKSTNVNADNIQKTNIKIQQHNTNQMVSEKHNLMSSNISKDIAKDKNTSNAESSLNYRRNSTAEPVLGKTTKMLDSAANRTVVNENKPHNSALILDKPHTDHNENELHNSALISDKSHTDHNESTHNSNNPTNEVNNTGMKSFSQEVQKHNSPPLSLPSESERIDTKTSTNRDNTPQSINISPKSIRVNPNAVKSVANSPGKKANDSIEESIPATKIHSTPEIASDDTNKINEDKTQYTSQDVISNNTANEIQVNNNTFDVTTSKTETRMFSRTAKINIPIYNQACSGESGRRSTIRTPSFAMRRSTITPQTRQTYHHSINGYNESNVEGRRSFRDENINSNINSSRVSSPNSSAPNDPSKSHRSTFSQTFNRIGNNVSKRRIESIWNDTYSSSRILRNVSHTNSNVRSMNMKPSTPGITLRLKT